MTGTILYEGPSLLDGKPIVAIATNSSTNRKTGNMVQVWILRKNIDPVKAVQSGADRSICGDCYHRGAPGRPRTCYVNMGQAPLSVWRAYRAGSYRKGRLEVEGRAVRLGAYGDPVAVPKEAFDGLHLATRWTGYTHQWRSIIARPWRNVLMASCDSPADMAEAAASGWRAFRVTALEEAPPDDAILCPSERGVQCADCGLCAGLQHASAPHIYIPAHGTSKRFVGKEAP